MKITTFQKISSKTFKTSTENGNEVAPLFGGSSYSHANQLLSVLTQSPASLWSIKILDSYVRNHLSLPISCIYLRSFELLEPTMLRLKCLVFWLQGIFKKRALSLEFAS